MSPLGTECFDIFSPPPGASDVMTQVERLSSRDTKIALRSVRIAACSSGRGQRACMVAPAWVVQHPTLPESKMLPVAPMGSSGPMPPGLACRFTVGELAVLRIVGDEVRQHGHCARCVDEIAVRAGSPQRSSHLQAERLVVTSA